MRPVFLETGSEIRSLSQFSQDLPNISGITYGPIQPTGLRYLPGKQITEAWLRLQAWRKQGFKVGMRLEASQPGQLTSLVDIIIEQKLKPDRLDLVLCGRRRVRELISLFGPVVNRVRDIDHPVCITTYPKDTAFEHLLRLRPIQGTALGLYVKKRAEVRQVAEVASSLSPVVIRASSDCHDIFTSLPNNVSIQMTVKGWPDSTALRSLTNLAH